MIQTSSLQTSDGFKLYTFEALAAGTPKALIYLVHGIGEHTGRYAHVIAHFNAAGYSVFGHDHRYHGQSEGEPRAGMTSFDVMVEDLKGRIESVKATHTGLKLFVYAHSMGSLISTLTLSKYPLLADGFISTGSPLQVDSAIPAFLRPVVLGLAKLVPNLPLGPIDNTKLSRDPKVMADYDSDPLNVRKPTTLAVAALFGRALPGARANLGNIKMPILILHGAIDTLTPPGGSQTLHDGIGSADTTLKFYPNLLHEIHNEPEQDIVLSDMTAWLDKRV
jgi:alpha-beta hydrolase superfamily lysophospholipase